MVSFCIETLRVKIHNFSQLTLKIGKISVFRRWWQNPFLFCHFREMMRHNQTGNITLKFWIPWQRERIAGQFLHWNFEGKNSHFFPNELRKLAKSMFFGDKTKCNPILSFYREMMRHNQTGNITTKFCNPSKRRWIAGQILCEYFEGKIHNFS